jgi:hypothetical protein
MGGTVGKCAPLCTWNSSNGAWVHSWDGSIPKPGHPG